jgi:hypothetical protein
MEVGGVCAGSGNVSFPRAILYIVHSKPDAFLDVDQMSKCRGRDRFN